MTADLILSPIAARSCIRCGATERNKKGDCKACSKILCAAWRAKNPDKAKKAEDAWRAANPERARAIRTAWRNANPEKAKASVAASRTANPGAEKATSAAWKKANREKVIAASTAWRKANPEAARIFQQNRRASQKESGGRLSKGLAKKLFKLQKGKCPCCAQALGKDAHLDHITPLARGGFNVDSNIQLLRAVCNMTKAAKDPLRFMQSRGFLL